MATLPTTAKNWLNRAVTHVPFGLRGVIRRLPGVAAAQRWVFRHFYEGRDFVHTIDAGPARGLKFFVQLPQDKAVWLGNYEQTFSAALADAVKPGEVCYDIGGYRGFMSGVLALAGARRVYVFEPMPDNLVALRRLIELNPELPITIRDHAVGAHDGPTRFLLLPDASMGKLESSGFQPERRGQRELEVRVAALDTLVAGGELEPPKLMKIDVEGAELFVLQGAQATVRRHRPGLYIEAHTRELAVACEQLLAGIGYEVRVMETGQPAADARTPEVSHLACRPKT